MLEQPLSCYHFERGKGAFGCCCTLWTTGDYDKIVLTGMGSSYFVSQTATYIDDLLIIYPFLLSMPGSYCIFQSSVLTEHFVIVAISQSGRKL